MRYDDLLSGGSAIHDLHSTTDSVRGRPVSRDNGCGFCPESGFRASRDTGGGFARRFESGLRRAADGGPADDALVVVRPGGRA